MNQKIIKDIETSIKKIEEGYGIRISACFNVYGTEYILTPSRTLVEWKTENCPYCGAE